MATKQSAPPPQRSKRELVPARPPGGSEPAQFTSVDASAVQALSSGTANEGQQKRALEWILKNACGLPTWAYRESQRETDIALGRQFVGQQIVGVLNVNISALRKRESRNEQRGDQEDA